MDYSRRNGHGRPATGRSQDMRVDADEEDSGWAGRQQEVDFSAKLTWGDSDEEADKRSREGDKSHSDDSQVSCSDL